MEKRYLATFFAAFLAACLAAGQPKPDPGGRGRGGRGGRRRSGKTFAEGATLVYVETLIRNFDKDQNMVVDEEELEKGFLAMLEKQEQRCSALLSVFDKDEDGALSKEESQAFRGFVFGLAGLLRYDPDGNWAVDETEADKAWESLGGRFERHNAGTIRKFDKDGNGELSPEEIAAAREQMQAWKDKGGK
ncbi:MAG: hypothetical protein HN742_43265 [Lentisphaerae bacterium]|jgi:Ca2+-binding EF-hand superfamily protein|nr:hypothetical protein [Lentisphaerota bacterium]MBT4820939.1 hypothetical protein [Lentisphaerota bacterium]MBT5609081.1 hypothetical protein [Lentisphaerota bacterium]MBT7057272.1 hypothetical protein [Lentisphaerota bacterium]MBT7848759.1 hypothetical protein [Lentisphaerota bacterium]